jgi:dTDP-4-dehydrorhamnose 3,5-epimerase-like enzyme
MNQPQIIQLPKISDVRGNLSFFESAAHLPFEIRRTFWIYDVPGGEERGGHAYHQSEEFIVALSGSFDVIVDDGLGNQQTFHMNRSYYGLFVPKMMWRQMTNFSTNSLALVCASTEYDPADYIFEYEAFYQLKSTWNPLFNLLPIQVPTYPDTQFDSTQSTVDDCHIIELDKHHSNRKGNLSVVENGKTIDFDVKRSYYLYDVPGGESRGAHAHRALKQLLIAVSGSFTVTLDDGKRKRAFTLNRPYQALFIQPGLWRDLDNFSSGSVCLCLASEHYQAEDYIRDYNEFLEFKNKQ